MSSQYNSLPLSLEAAQLALAQHAAEQSTRLPSPTGGEPHIPTLVEPAPAPGCVGPSGPVEDSHLRHIIIGSPEGVQEAIARLHMLHYVERRYWTPPMPIRDQGLRITPNLGQVMSYLVQQRPLR